MYSGKAIEEFSLEKLRASDREEFSRLVEAYYTMIYNLAFRMLNDPQDAEDTLQETFLKAYRGLKDFDGRSSVSTWLYRIATNEALMHLRRRKMDTVSIDASKDSDEGEQEPLQIVDWCCMPEEELVSAEALAHLNEAVTRLSPNLRAVFVLRDIQGLSTREVEEVLNLSETAVKTRLSRARLQLREDLSSYYGGRLEGGKRG
jgi:RNA polymerase sigma-70 factor (ECF subfamily)